ncbi:MAG: 30S ribosomal protein S16 [Patescibacteria group bacterium]|nr:30S ribosomal protein S16 [Patescibacteria group bacterium]MDD5295118.1 30S ribosomal protein S16 [Patescibacteria group bacterium]MDD5554308.1 30S ribosomal protein S16 [Patescibacteria group bacterium]
MLAIRLSRIGKKNKPMYRLIISEKSRDLYGQSLEILGSYNPHSKELQVKTERINYWLGKGAGMSPTVNNLLIEKGIIKGEKVKASKPGRKSEAAPVAASQPKETKEAKPAEVEIKEGKPAEPEINKETETKTE